MAVKTRSNFKSGQATTFADNTSGDITAANLRSEMVNLADSAAFPEDLGALALKSTIAITDVAAAGTPSGSTYLRGDGTWATPAGGGGGGGDMLASVYDPTNRAANAFSMDNMVEGSATKIMTSAERTKLSGVATNANNYVHPNHFGDVSSVADGTTTINASVVTNAKMANMTSARIKGRITAGSGAPEDLTGTQLTTLLDVFTTSLKGVVPASGGGTTTFLRADGTWASPSAVSLGSVAADVLPDANNTRDLGSDTLRWAEGHFGATLKLGGYNVVTENATALSQKATPVGADKVPGFDSANSDATVYFTLSSIVSALAVPSSRTLTAGTGIATLGDLSANRTVALSAGSIASLALADTAVQPSRTLTAGTGIATIGDLSANRTIALSSGSIASLALADAAAPKLVTENAQTGTGYTLVLGDAGKLVTMNNSSANLVTIPTNASVAYPVGTVINIEQIGSGVTSVKGDTGVTLNGVSAGTGAISSRWSGVSLWKRATNEWTVMGGIGAVA